jgi:hypothetical protein
MEPGNKGAVILPFGQFPGAWEPKGSRIAVAFARFFTRIAYLDVALLATYKSDSAADRLGQHDPRPSRAFRRVVHVGREEDARRAQHDDRRKRHRPLAGNHGRHRPRHLGPVAHHHAVDRQLVRRRHRPDESHYGDEFFKWQRNEVGGDKSQDWLLSGKMSEDIMGVKCVKTIKKALVPTNTVFFFASPDVLGRNYSFEAPTMWTQRIGPQVKWMCYMSNGRVLANVNAVAAVTFTP